MRHYKDLAIAEEESKLEQAIGEHRNLLVEAPTGSGKSLYIPWFLSRHCEGRVVVLQPRRIAAISLAQYSAKLHEESCGKTVGYQVRQDSCKSAETKILFQTYGNFLQELLHGKMEADWVVFDEYHERKADMDLLFSYLLKGGPRIAVMSAKLNRTEMENTLGVKCLELGHPLYPVQILHQNPTTGNTLEAEVIKALRTLKLNDVWKTTLVFLPGKGEIMRCHTAAEEALGNQAAEYLDLFGGQERNIQDRIFEETERPRVIFTTNIAETSITVPNVSGVVDSGIERVSEYDDSEKVNVLRTSAISMQNAIQRSGRSGRTQNGCAIRLWSEETEKRMPQGIIPEVTQIEPSELLLQKASLEKKVGNLALPTDIPENRKQAALKLLEGFGMLEAGAITELGEKAIRTPVTDIPLALILATAKEASDLPDLTLAAMAWIHSGTEFVQKSKQPLNLITLASDTLKGSGAPREVSYTLRQLQDYRKSVFGNEATSKNDDQQQLIRTLLHSYPDRVATPSASQNGGVYKLDNGNVIRLQVTEPPYAIISLSMLRTGGGSKSELRVNLYVPVPKEMLVNDSEPARYELLWRSGQERFIGKEIQGSSEREILPQEASPAVLSKLKELTVEAWKEKLAKENWDGKFLTENVQTLLIKMRLAAKLYPEFGLPEFNEEDMELIFDEFTDGVFLLRDINEDRYRNIVEEYFGKSMLNWLSKTFPDHYTLPNGKKARYSYQEVDVPEPGTPGSNLMTQSAEGVLIEVSARIEDFMQVDRASGKASPITGEHRIADGKLPVRYDILAPNFRSMQKTWDLTGFWKNTYPELRKELRGRYPKHPWPEAVL
ncbi:MULTISPECIES: ATP-dependent helicase C-terminal domain-containing protein [unclassified Fibrobacter]|uniref:ATP-dependent helicase C-terminal domain-containing protein n=1 Tax=unclassified Fibrobacter TaxID=2634177 RepID=UPI000D6CC0D2|nr:MULTISPECIES: ATP-dependent helicase C-terminal domain-containing protein [unclassified Fibrobacter]PWJ69944.1 HrpA-like RNA helicase [Fibrobacter sp. UWR4]PZW73115.1 HrpA-like RNA helicase [Fibrobacter sp. UWR1]